jgi:hypothetical protein
MAVIMMENISEVATFNERDVDHFLTLSPKSECQWKMDLSLAVVILPMNNCYFIIELFSFM